MSHEATTPSGLLSPSNDLPAACDDVVAREILPKVYDSLRAIAQRYLGKERIDHTLQPTALVHEAYLRLSASDREYVDAPHFLAVAASAMRHILVDHARQHLAGKRGRREPNGRGGRFATDGGDDPVAIDRRFQVLELDDLLHRLNALDPRKARVVELRFFAAMTLDQIALAIGAARSTIADDWSVARAWLASQMTADGAMS